MAACMTATTCECTMSGQIIPWSWRARHGVKLELGHRGGAVPLTKTSRNCCCGREIIMHTRLERTCAAAASAWDAASWPRRVAASSASASRAAETAEAAAWASPSSACSLELYSCSCPQYCWAWARASSCCAAWHQRAPRAACQNDFLATGLNIHT